MIIDIFICFLCGIGLSVYSDENKVLLKKRGNDVNFVEKLKDNCEVVYFYFCVYGFICFCGY